jgi:large subunit ribosomal protein L6
MSNYLIKKQIKQYYLNLPKNLNIVLKNNILYLKYLNKFTYIPILKEINFYIKQDKLILYLNLNKFKNNSNLFKLFNLFTNILNNKIIGLTTGFYYLVKCEGLGYKLKVNNNKLILKLGFSHFVYIKIPKNFFIFCLNNQTIFIYGIDKQQLKLFINKLKKIRKFNIYKGKGIKLLNEVIKLKKGKKN